VLSRGGRKGGEEETGPERRDRAYSRKGTPPQERSGKEKALPKEGREGASEKGWGDLSDRLDLLATLYRASGDLDKALAVLEESKKLCGSHGVPFDGEDLLREYRKEKGNTRDDRASAS
jgi:hypothetical protein